MSGLQMQLIRREDSATLPLELEPYRRPVDGWGQQRPHPGIQGCCSALGAVRAGAGRSWMLPIARTEPAPAWIDSPPVSALRSLF